MNAHFFAMTAATWWSLAVVGLSVAAIAAVMAATDADQNWRAGAVGLLVALNLVGYWPLWALAAEIGAGGALFIKAGWIVQSVLCVVLAVAWIPDSGSLRTRRQQPSQAAAPPPQAPPAGTTFVPPGAPRRLRFATSTNLPRPPRRGRRH